MFQIKHELHPSSVIARDHGNYFFFRCRCNPFAERNEQLDKCIFPERIVFVRGRQIAFRMNVTHTNFWNAFRYPATTMAHDSERNFLLFILSHKSVLHQMSYLVQVDLVRFRYKIVKVSKSF